MNYANQSALLAQRLSTPLESPAERQRRERRSIQVARQMLANGCSANDVIRHTGLKEEQLRKV